MEDTSGLPFLYLTTTGWKSGRSHQIEIWFTALEDCFYIIAERGEETHWVQNLRRQPAVTFRVGGQTFEGTGRVVEAAREPELHRQVQQLSEVKYGWGDGLVVELKPA
ncbi:MAG: nitroreductase family deazaflavin-dependent oxidoreductase [Anaerolineales bacterium]|nr:nitroreductase family deazaflavin-dependent oxidoreductase [Anaerolineales bacterium]